MYESEMSTYFFTGFLPLQTVAKKNIVLQFLCVTFQSFLIFSSCHQEKSGILNILNLPSVDKTFYSSDFT